MGEKSFFDESNERGRSSASVDVEDNFEDTATSRWGATMLRWVLVLFVVALFALVAWFASSIALLVVGVFVGAVLFSCAHIMLEWERAVVMRFGRFNRVAGPGLIFMIPFVEYASAVIDLRMRSTSFKAERVLTSDLVPVNVDAVLFWMVWDAGKACSEIRNFEKLVFWVAQTTLRDVIGGMNISQMGMRRAQMDKEIADILERKTSEWGITVVSVEISDIKIPEELQEAMSAEARAEREYNARIILAEVEKEISEMFVDAARIYKEEDAALQLRAMSFVSDSVKEKGGLVVIPSALSEAFEGLESIAKKR
ncbi:MAG: slipin family protein [Gordonibacter sp.]|uniref:slipin family protein n=1 Tax=Gordonibacter sp. TaxID=1968902 RepID=UPI002FC69D66